MNIFKLSGFHILMNEHTKMKEDMYKRTKLFHRKFIENVFTCGYFIENAFTCGLK